MKPIYYHSAQHAREHGEIEQYRETSQLLGICRKDIETICKARFDGWHLDKVAVPEVTTVHGDELTALVLSATILEKESDGRFSRHVKAWAHTVKQLEGERTYKSYIVETHPTILNGFAELFINSTH